MISCLLLLFVIKDVEMTSCYEYSTAEDCNQQLDCGFYVDNEGNPHCTWHQCQVDNAEEETCWDGGWEYNRCAFERTSQTCRLSPCLMNAPDACPSSCEVSYSNWGGQLLCMDRLDCSAAASYSTCPYPGCTWTESGCVVSCNSYTTTAECNEHSYCGIYVDYDGNPHCVEHQCQVDTAVEETCWSGWESNRCTFDRTSQTCRLSPCLMNAPDACPSSCEVSYSIWRGQLLCMDRLDCSAAFSYSACPYPGCTWTGSGCVPLPCDENNCRQCKQTQCTALSSNCTWNSRSGCNTIPCSSHTTTAECNEHSNCGVYTDYEGWHCIEHQCQVSVSSSGEVKCWDGGWNANRCAFNTDTQSCRLHPCLMNFPDACPSPCVTMQSNWIGTTLCHGPVNCSEYYYSDECEYFGCVWSEESGCLSPPSCDESHCSLCTFTPTNPAAIGPCTTGCVSQNRVCVDECAESFVVIDSHPGYCISVEVDIVEDNCPSGNCLQEALDNLQVSGDDAYSILVFASRVSLSANIEIEKNLTLEGVSVAATTLDVGVYQISFVASVPDSEFFIGSITLSRLTQGDLPILRANIGGGGSDPSGTITLHEVDVLYNYEPTLTNAPLIIEALQFLLESVTIRRVSYTLSGTVALHHTYAQANANADDCVQFTEHPSLRLKDASGIFRNVLFEAAVSGALSAESGALQFEGVEFKQNKITGYGSAYSNIRHNGYFKNTALSIGVVKSDVVTGGAYNLFFTVDPTDISTTITPASLDGVYLLFSPIATAFEIVEGNGNIGARGVLTGTFVTCSYRVKVFLNGAQVNAGGDGTGGLELTVESPNTASFSFTDGTLANNVMYEFQFVSKIGNYAETSPKYALTSVSNNGDDDDDNGDDDDSGLGVGTIIAIVVPIAVVVVACGVVATVLVVLYKKKAGPFRKKRIETTEQETGNETERKNDAVTAAVLPADNLGGITAPVTL